MWALGELSLDYQRDDVGGSFGYPEDYLARNPNRVVPTIQDGEMVLWESNACVRYLARTYGQGGLWPADAKVLAHADQWMDWQAALLGPAFFQIFYNQIRLGPEKGDRAQLAEGVKNCARFYQVLDRHLSRCDYLAGSQFTMGDIPVGAMTYRYMALEIDRPAIPHVNDWYSRLIKRTAYQHHVAVPFGRNPAEWQRAEDENAGLQ